MKLRSLLAVSLVASVASTLSYAAPPMEAPHVTEVFVLDIAGNMPKFMEVTKRMQDLSKKNGMHGMARYWIAGWAGADVGKVIVAVEFPSLLVLAQDAEKMMGDPEYQKVQADAMASGMKIVSASLVTEIKAQ
jgi:hypothetical protein